MTVSSQSYLLASLSLLLLKIYYSFCPFSLIIPPILPHDLIIHKISTVTSILITSKYASSESWSHITRCLLHLHCVSCKFLKLSMSIDEDIIYNPLLGFLLELTITTLLCKCPISFTCQSSVCLSYKDQIP